MVVTMPVMLDDAKSVALSVWVFCILGVLAGPMNVALKVPSPLVRME